MEGFGILMTVTVVFFLLGLSVVGVKFAFTSPFPDNYLNWECTKVIYPIKGMPQKGTCLQFTYIGK